MKGTHFRFGNWSSRAFVVGVFFIPCSLALWLVLRQSPAPRFDKLRHLEGRLLSAQLRRPNQTRSYYQFELDSLGERLLVQVPDLSYHVPALRTLAPGQWVEIWVDPAGGAGVQAVYWAWQIQRARDRILTYEERVKSYEGGSIRMGYLAAAMGVIGFVMATLAGLHAWIVGIRKVATESQCSSG